jgi:hypothetical protein
MLTAWEGGVKETPLLLSGLPLKGGAAFPAEFAALAVDPAALPAEAAALAWEAAAGLGLAAPPLWVGAAALWVAAALETAALLAAGTLWLGLLPGEGGAVAAGAGATPGWLLEPALRGDWEAAGSTGSAPSSSTSVLLEDCFAPCGSGNRANKFGMTRLTSACFIFSIRCNIPLGLSFHTVTKREEWPIA